MLTQTEATNTIETSTALPPLEYEAPPQYPEGIADNSAVNAQNFVTFAIETLNYAQRSNDIDAVEAISAQDCTFCEDFTQLLSDLSEHSLRRIGAELSCAVYEVSYQEATGTFFLDSSCTTMSGGDYESSGNLVTSFEPTEITITWAVGLIDGVWRLVNAGGTTTQPQS